PRPNLKRVGGRGARLPEGPIQVPNGPRICFMRAPDDTRIELIEPPKKPASGGWCSMATHRIAVIPGDGSGKEIVPEGMRVLEAAGRRFGFDFAWTRLDWS